LVPEGVLSVVHIGRQLGVDPDALEEWIKASGQGDREIAATVSPNEWATVL